MITKKIIAPLIIVIILAGIGGVLTAKKTTENRLASTTNATIDSEPQTKKSEDLTVKEQLKSGRYEPYRLPILPAPARDISSATFST